MVSSFSEYAPAETGLELLLVRFSIEVYVKQKNESFFSCGTGGILA
jgi:hypothetical protein